MSACRIPPTSRNPSAIVLGSGGKLPDAAASSITSSASWLHAVEGSWPGLPVDLWRQACEKWTLTTPSSHSTWLTRESASSRTSLISSCSSPGWPGSGLLRFPQGEGGAGGVGDDAHPAVFADLRDLLANGRAERAGLLGGGSDVVDRDVGEPVRRHVGAAHHAAAGAFAHVDHGVASAAARHRQVLQFPVEELRVERLGPGEVAGMQLDVHEWVCHARSSFDLQFRMPAAGRRPASHAARGRGRACAQRGEGGGGSGRQPNGGAWASGTPTERRVSRDRYIVPTMLPQDT